MVMLADHEPGCVCGSTIRISVGLDIPRSFAAPVVVNSCLAGDDEGSGLFRRRATPALWRFGRGGVTDLRLITGQFETQKFPGRKILSSEVGSYYLLEAIPGWRSGVTSGRGPMQLKTAGWAGFIHFRLVVGQFGDPFWRGVEILGGVVGSRCGMRPGNRVRASEEGGVELVAGWGLNQPWPRSSW